MKQYIVDAFTKRVFHGNPAAVCVMEAWLSDELMQQIAIENNLSETAFMVREGERYHIRWFTPGAEVDLCGHATLATSFVLTRFFDPQAEELVFTSLSGELRVRKADELLELDFPSRMPRPVPFTTQMRQLVHGLPAQAYVDRDLILVLEDEQSVRDYIPDYAAISALEGELGLFITAPSRTYDFVSRTFFPKLKINEDPAPRGGVLYCEDRGDRVRIGGHAVLYSEAEIRV